MDKVLITKLFVNTICKCCEKPIQIYKNLNLFIRSWQAALTKLQTRALTIILEKAFSQLKYTDILLILFPIKSMLRSTWMHLTLTLKLPRKPASENVVCLCRLLNILANFSNIFAYWQTVRTKIKLLLEEQSDLGPHRLQK